MLPEHEDAAVELSRRILAPFLERWARIYHNEGHPYASDLCWILAHRIRSRRPEDVSAMRDAIRSAQRGDLPGL